MRIWIGNHYFSEREKPALAEEIEDVLGRTYDEVELFGNLPSSYEGKLTINDLSKIFEIVEYGSRELLANREDAVGDTQNWVRY